MIIAWINFISYNISGILIIYLTILGIMPASREEKHGPVAWEESAKYRSICEIFEVLMIINIILWIWFPIQELNWVIHKNFIVGIVIAVIIGIPSVVIMIKGVKEAGDETIKPSKETAMFAGIYHYIRHPQYLGWFSMLIAIAFGINSLFLVLWSLFTSIVILSIIIHYEEKDLVKRFGDAYIKYQQETGALIPKFWRKNRKNNLDEK